MLLQSNAYLYVLWNGSKHDECQVSVPSNITYLYICIYMFLTFIRVIHFCVCCNFFYRGIGNKAEFQKSYYLHDLVLFSRRTILNVFLDFSVWIEKWKVVTYDVKLQKIKSNDKSNLQKFHWNSIHVHVNLIF